MAWTTPDSVHSCCGAHASYPCSRTIDEDTSGVGWYHPDTCQHWIIFDLGETKTVTKVRLFQYGTAALRFGTDQGVVVCVSDSPISWGAPVWSGVLNDAGWMESGAFQKAGRYIKLVSGDDVGQILNEFDYEEKVLQTYYKSIGGTLASTGAVSPVEVAGVQVGGTLASSGDVVALPTFRVAVQGVMGSSGALEAFFIPTFRFVTPQGFQVGGIFVANFLRGLYRTSGDNRYVISSNDIVGETLQAWKSTDGGLSWASVGGTGPANGLVTSIGGSGVIDSQGVIHIVWTNWTDEKVYYVTFDTSEDTWGSRETVVDSAGLGDIHCVSSITVDSDDKPHVVWCEDVAGYSGIYYKNKTGEAWSDAETLQEGAANDYGERPDIMVDGNDVLHVAYIYYGGPVTIREIMWLKGTSGSWGSEEVAGTLVSSALRPSVCINSSNEPVIAYGKAESGALRTWHVTTREGVDDWAAEDPYPWEEGDLALISVNLALWADEYYLLGHTAWQDGGLQSQGYAGAKREGEWTEKVLLEGSELAPNPVLPPGWQFEGPMLRYGPNEVSRRRFEYVWWCERMTYVPAADDVCWSHVPEWTLSNVQSLAGALILAGTLARKAWAEAEGVLASTGALAATLIRVKDDLSGELVSGASLARQTHFSLAGTLASSGALVSQAKKALAGTLASAGTLTGKALKALTGTLTSGGGTIRKVSLPLAGVLTSSGALGTVATWSRAFAGTLASTGYLGTKLLIEVAYKELAGTLTSSGALVRKTLLYPRRTRGSLTSSGVVEKVATSYRSFAGTLSSGGTLVVKVSTALAGALTSSGSLAAKAGKALAGVLTSGGALTTISTWSRSLAGTVTSVGSLVATKFAGTYYRTFTGILTPSGVLARKVSTSLVGTLTSSGVVSTVTTWALSLAGTLSGAGALSIKAIKALAGTLTSAGTVVGKASKALSGVLTLSGTVATTLYKFITPISLSGSISPTGALAAAKVVGQSIAGTLTSSGAAATQFITGRLLEGTLTMAGTLARTTGVAFSGTLSLAGGLLKKSWRALAGVLGTAGSLIARLWGPGKVIEVQGSVDTTIDVTGSVDTLIEVEGSDDTTIDVKGSV